MNTRHRDDQIIEEAAEWVAGLDNPSPEHQQALANWLTESPRHIEEFLLTYEIDRALNGIDPDHEIDIETFRAGSFSNVIHLENSQGSNESPPLNLPRSRRSKVSRRWLTAATLAVFITGAMWSIATYPQWYGYTTNVGEIRSFELSDGSVIHLNTKSRVKVHFSESERSLELLAGEAMFKVQQDIARPFRVNVGATSIQAIGTQFNVYLRPQKTTVSVIEGSVGISEVAGKQSRNSETAAGLPNTSPTNSKITQLVAGRETSISRSGQIDQPAEMNIAKVTAWRQRRLLFKDDTLGDIAVEFNRYNRKPQIRLEDPVIAQKRLSGIFDVDAPESLLRFLERNEELSVVKTEDKVFIKAR